MAYLFKPSYKRRGGKRRTLSRWYIRIRDAGGRLRSVKGYRDKAATLAKATELERRFERQCAGLSDSHDEQARRPIGEHLAEFERDLSAKGRVPRHVRLVVSHVRRIIEACRFSTAADLRASRVQEFLGEERSAGMSAQTATHYVRNVRQFSRWLVRNLRIGEDLLVTLEGYRVESDRRLVRRALDSEEAARLLDATHGSAIKVRGLGGLQREALYLTAMRTGLRAAELASLTPHSVTLDANPPMITLDARASKNRKAAALPLHREAVDLLRPLVMRTLPEARLWPGSWWKYAAKMLRHDLDAADIPFEVDGERLDFHALRHSLGTFACQAGMHPRLAQQLMRHSDINLTMQRYTHPAILDLAAAVENMPRIRPAPREVATGTEGSSNRDGAHALLHAPQHAVPADSAGSRATCPDKIQRPEARSREPRKRGQGRELTTGGDRRRAEGEGFEPPVELPPQQFSRLPP